MLTLHNILKELGFKEEDGKLFIESDAEILKAYPRLLRDDGMAYGVEPEYIIEADESIYKCKLMVEDFVCTGDNPKLDIDKIEKEDIINVFNIFRDIPHNKLPNGERDETIEENE